MPMAKEAGLCRLAIVVALAGSAASCLGSDDGKDKTSGALLTNVSYKFGGVTLQTHGGTDPWGTLFGSAAYFSYVRTDSKIGIIVETDLGNGTGQNATTYNFSDTTNGGASLVSYNGLLWMFYFGMNHQLYMRRSSTGAAGSWDGPYQLSGSGQFTPAPVVWNDTLYLYSAEVCTPGCNGSEILQGHMSGAQYIADGSINEFTNNTVTAASWNGLLYVSWAGTDSDNPIYIKHYDSYFGWSSPYNIPNNWGRPAFFQVGDGDLAIAYRGSNGHIYRVYTNDGMNFTSPIGDNASTTNQTPIPFMQWFASDLWVV
ncbi:MAG TPA: hypothetical protein VG713_03210, partial [Pirellulales bacterium]|nr:hypothetical protein [Pirellulales bacterium]